MYLFFDTETTGLPKRRGAPVSETANWPRVVQLGWAPYRHDGQRVAGEAHLIKPVGFTIPAEAARIHRITTQMALSRGSDLNQVLGAFAAAATRATSFVAHNVEFDGPILHAEYIRQQLPIPFGTQSWYCTMALSTDFCGIPGPYGPKWPKLSELHQRLFGRPHIEAHDAAGDLEACARCFFELVRLDIIRL